MNKIRREKLKTIAVKLKDINSELSKILDEENYCFDNMPENLQNSFRGNNSEDAIEIMEESIEKIKEIIDELITI